MPFNISKPIVGILGSRSITNLNISNFINPEHCAEIVCGGESAIDTLAKQFAKSNKIEYIEFKPNYDLYDIDARLIRDKEIIEYVDAAIVFWDGQDRNIIKAISYADKIECQYILHQIDDLD